MDFSEVLSLAVPAVYVLVGVVLVWLAIELAITVRRTRKTVNQVQQQLEPTLESAARITASLEPVAAKVDPLVERVSLTVDAANLEIMRVDQILEDVSEVTGTLSDAVETVDNVANVPMELVNTMSDRVRKAFKPRRASEESIALGSAKAEEPVGAAAMAAAVADAGKQAAVTITQAAKDAVSEQREARREQKAQREQEEIERKAQHVRTDQAVNQVAAAVTSVAAADSAAAQQGYFTYGDAGQEKPAEASGSTSEIGAAAHE